MRHRWMIAMAAAWVAAWVQVAPAQPEEPAQPEAQTDEPDGEASEPSAVDLEKAKRLFQSAEALKTLGDEQAARGEEDKARETYGRAARDYLKAYELSELPLFLYNLGSIYRLRGDTEWAIRCYRAFLATEPASEQDVKDTETFIEDLEGELAARETTRAGDPALDPSGVCGPAEEAEPVEPEPVEPEPADKPGGTGETGSTGETGATGPTGPTEPPVEDLDEASGSGGAYRWAFGGTAGVTAASAVVAIMMFAEVSSLEEKKEEAIRDSSVPLEQGDACADAEDKGVQEVVDICDKGRSRAMLGNVFLGASVVGAVAAGYFFYRGYMGSAEGKEAAAQPATALRPVLSPTAVGAELTWRF